MRIVSWCLSLQTWSIVGLMSSVCLLWCWDGDQQLYFMIQCGYTYLPGITVAFSVGASEDCAGIFKIFSEYKPRKHLHYSIKYQQASLNCNIVYMSKLLDALRSGAKLLERRDDDSFDRLSNRYSIAVLVMLIGFIAMETYVATPISCFAPKEFLVQWNKYTDNYCWVSNTYYHPFNVNLQPTIPPGGLVPGAITGYKQEIAYYQWVPIILTFCAFTFSIPAQLWSWASNSGGYDVQAMVKATAGADNLNPEVRDKTVGYLVAQMDRLLGYRRPYLRKGVMGRVRRVKPLAVGKRFGSFLFGMYILVKCLYITNAIILLFILDAMVGDGYHNYGIEVMRKWNNPSYEGTRRFPYVTMCDFWVRRMGTNMHRYTVQCALPVNLFNEKIFMILWFWLVFVAISSVVGLMLWIFTAIPSVKKEFVTKYLVIMGKIHKGSSSDLLSEFVHGYLRLDGVFCMRLIIKNTNDAIGGEILAACWDHFLFSRKSEPSEVMNDDGDVTSPVVVRTASV